MVEKSLNFHTVYIKYAQVWKLQYFSITQILREIKVGDFIGQKMAFVEVPEPQKAISHKI